MKLKFLTLLLLAAGALTAACSDDDNTGPDGEARVRVVHASPDAPDVDVLLDDAEVLGDVPYLTASNYLGVPAGDHNLKVNAAGTATTVIDADVNLVDGTDYTVIASGLVEAIEPIVLQDDNSPPAAGNARVRAITARRARRRWTSTSPRRARISRPRSRCSSAWSSGTSPTTSRRPPATTRCG